uniref:Uncharacterized protein n=1 Tax=Rhizophora mucronata TaxID=61149 RepID=A0A2P2NSQ3_RHIMU
MLPFAFSSEIFHVSKSKWATTLLGLNCYANLAMLPDPSKPG